VVSLTGNDLHTVDMRHLEGENIYERLEIMRFPGRHSAYALGLISADIFCIDIWTPGGAYTRRGLHQWIGEINEYPEAKDSCWPDDAPVGRLYFR
jgi:hypothetical protein